MDKITINKFVDGYKQCISDEAKKNYLKRTLFIYSHLSYMTKANLAKKIVNSSYWSEDPVTHNKKFTKNSVAKNLLYYRSIVENYTNLIVSDNIFVNDYDNLYKYGLLDIIINSIPEKELVEYNKILQLTEDDYIFNYTEPHNFISSILNNVSYFSKDILPEFLKNNQKNN